MRSIRPLGRQSGLYIQNTKFMISYAEFMISNAKFMNSTYKSGLVGHPWCDRREVNHLCSSVAIPLS